MAPEPAEVTLVVPFPLPDMPRGFETVVRTMVGGVPALIAVIVGTLILLIALFLGTDRRTYALQAATCAFDTARALVGLTATTTKKAGKDRKVEKPGSNRRSSNQRGP